MRNPTEMNLDELLERSGHMHSQFAAQELMRELGRRLMLAVTALKNVRKGVFTTSFTIAENTLREIGALETKDGGNNE